MWVIGLDLSLNSTGVCVGSTESFAPEITNTIIPDKKLSQDARISEIAFQLSNMWSILSVKGTGPGIIFFIEGLSFTRNSASLTILAELAGVVKYLLRDRDLRYFIIPPTTLKSFITGKGSAKKEQMLLSIYKKWNREFDTSDEADAFALVQLGKALLGDSNDKKIVELRKKLGVI